MDLITVTRKERRAFDVRVRRHVVTSDMAPGDGGQDAGFAPVELLAGSLGACIAIMVQSYCDTHGYTDGEVAVSMTLELADDPKRIAAIVADVELPQGVPEDRMAAVRRVAEQCVIHHTLAHPPRLDVEFV
jgi:putative redox protein